MTNEGNIYYAAEGCFIVRKADNFIMGEAIDLGTADSIDNYEDQPYTEESYKEFYESLGIDQPHTEDLNNSIATETPQGDENA